MFQKSEISDFLVIYLVSALVVLLLVAAILVYAFFHQKKLVQLRVQLHEEELRRRQAIFDALQEGQEQERSRLSQELHDGIGAKLSGLKMTLEYLKSNATENVALLSKVYAEVADTLEEMREISHNLQPYFFNRSIEQLLQNQMEQLNTSGDCRYVLEAGPSEVQPGPTVKLHVYRIVAELLNNIHKHARASQASVQINTEQDKMEIVVEDNGVGLYNAQSNAQGIGLKNINHRINICKGHINIDSSGSGTTVIISIPLNTTP